MIVIPPIGINETNIISNSLAEPSVAPTAWTPSTAYSEGDIRYRLSNYRIYRARIVVGSGVTTLPESDPARWEDIGPYEVIWNAATNYTIGQIVYRDTTHRRYENTIAGIDATLPELVPTRWLDIGATNKYTLFDTGRNEDSVAITSMVFEISPGERINSAAVLGVVASSVQIEMYVSAVQVYTKTINMTTRSTTTWTQYFFGKFGYKPSALVLDLPYYANSVIKITLTNTGTLPVRCSGVVLGNNVYLGATQYNAESDSLNFSKIERDFAGKSVLLARRTVPKTSQQTWLPKGLVNQAVDIRKLLNAVPALWSGLDEQSTDDYFESLLIFGIYKQFKIDISKPQVAVVTLELEEL